MTEIVNGLKRFLNDRDFGVTFSKPVTDRGTRNLLTILEILE